MDGQDYKGGLKKRPKLAVINMDSDDDEPIRSFLKLKSKRNNKKVKLEIDGVKGKKIEVKGEKDVVGDEDLGGMEDTLASFRKKLKGPKKDGGSGSLLKKELALNLAELSDGCLDRPQNGEDFVAELAKGDEDKVGHVTSDVNNGQKSEKKRERKLNSSKSASPAKTLGGAVNSDGVGIEKVDSSENQMERQEGQTMHKKKTRRSKSVLAGSSLRASVDLDDGEFPDEHALEDQAEVKEGLSSMLEKNLLEGQTKHKNKARRSKSVFTGNSLTATVDLDDGEIPDENTLGDLVEGKEGLSSMLEENLADSLSSFLKKAQKVHSGSHKKSRASACTKSAGVQIMSDRGLSSDCVSSDSQSFPGRNTLSDKELGSENQKSYDHLSGSGHICLSDPQVRSDGDQDLDVLNGNQLQSAPISDPMNCDSPTTGERSGDVRGGDTSEPIVAVPIVQESSCSLVACAEKKGELKSSEVCGEAGVTQDEPLIDSLDKLCEKDASESPSAEIKKQCTSGSQNDELYNGVSLCDPLNSSSRVVDVACSSSGSELMAELSNPERHESNVISDGKCGEDVIDTVRIDPLRADNVRGDGAPKEILVDEAANEIALPSVLPNENGACQEDAGSFSEANNNLSNNLASNERAVRKAKKRKDGDMAYEGDTAWEVLELEHCAVVDRDQGARSRGRLCSSSNIDPDLETGRVAAVSVGLKAHAVGPVEKIKFKEVLKRKGGLQEYFECRNKILSLWNKDVTRILPFTDCGVTTIPSDNEASCASLMRDIYSFLDQSGYINAGIATNKEKAEPHSRGNYKLLGEKKFEGSSGASVADSADGVSFILGQVKSADTISKTKNDLALDDENPSKQAVKRDEERVFDPSPDKLHDECKDVEMLDKQQTDVKISEIIVGAECSPAKVVGESLENDAVCNHLMTLGQLEGSDYMHHDLKNQKRIIVVGAGPAGLTAARHLQRQGLGVTVLEARSRIGGRVYTDRSSLSVPVDLGASIITGVEADVTSERRPDPSSLVCAQLGLELTILNSDCPLYDIVTGQKVPTDVDEALEAEFNSLLDDMVLVVAQKGESAARMSLEDGLEYGLKMRHKGDGESKILRPLVASFNHGNGNDGCSAQKGGVKDKTVSPLERRVMDWHFAHLEYGCAALLKDVSLPHWNQDDVYGGFGGAHCMIKGGYGAVVESIAQGLSIHLNQVVADISYGGMDLARVDNCSHKVKVSTSSGNEFFGDAVLITVPLGCLKADSIKFSPPLPEWKHSAIQRLGFGILNKVVLEFAEVFWDDTVDYFGATAEQTDLRGRCFMFWNVKKTVGAPVLIALLVGKAALDGQDVNPSEQVSHAVAVLRKLFGDAAVPDPVASVVTNWGRDPFSYGAYSYVAVGSSGEDYDILGRPVENCLFFAGEATCKEHPDTVGGAMMSGLREAVRIIDILNTGNDYTAEAEAIEAAQRQSNSERNEVKDIARRLDDLSDVLFKSPLHKSQALARESLLKDMFFSAKTSAGRLRLAKELLNLPVESLKSFAGTREGLSVLNSWILDSMGKDATQLLRHCVRILVFVSTDLVAVRLSGIGKTVKEKVCVHTSRDIRSIASQLVNIWIEVFRKEKATNGGLKLLRHMANSDSVKARGKGSRKPPISVHHCATGSKTPLSSKKPTGKQVKLETGTGSKTESKVEQDENLPLSEEERAAVAAAEAAHAAALAAAEAYASSEARFSKMQLPKIPSFQKFARQEQYGQMDESEKKRWSGGVLGRQDCISEIDSRNCRVRDWSVDFSAACANLDPSRLSADNLSQRSLSNDMPQLNWREHSGESAAGDSSAFTKAWVDSSGSVGIKDYHAIERWQCQAAAAEYEFQSSMHIGDEEDSSSMSKLLPRKHEGLVNESSVSQVTVNKELTVNQRRGAEHIKQGVVDYVASLLMPLYKSRKIDRDGYKSIMKKSATKVMEQTTDAEKAMAVSEFLDFKRKNKIRAFVDKLIERHMAMKPVVKP